MTLLGIDGLGMIRPRLGQNSWEEKVLPILFEKLKIIGRGIRY